jgi:hypothetical protein
LSTGTGAERIAMPIGFVSLADFPDNLGAFVML